tara:strand:+ start:2215 stop:2520 length:306 start_codon:yes stop_codon:yes gene_type:complete
LEALGFQVELVPVYVPGAQTPYIVFQDPSALAEVAQGSTVQILIAVNDQTFQQDEQFSNGEKECLEASGEGSGLGRGGLEGGWQDRPLRGGILTTNYVPDG